MRENPLYRVRWSGVNCIGEVRDKLARYGRAEIQLPPDYHHALYRRFHDGGTATAQLLQVSDGADLMHRILGVKGLEDLARVEDLVRETGAHVELVSPVPLITLHVESAPS
ncbi:MAG: hypothetical protein M0R77_18200 [Gammaproteobacteria bacterium]|nr:hypothetical protein [Gammaproteobacteria bacterium]